MQSLVSSPSSQAQVRGALPFPWSVLAFTEWIQIHAKVNLNLQCCKLSCRVVDLLNRFVRRFPAAVFDHQRLMRSEQMEPVVGWWARGPHREKSPHARRVDGGETRPSSLTPRLANPTSEGLRHVGVWVAACGQLAETSEKGKGRQGEKNQNSEGLKDVEESLG